MERTKIEIPLYGGIFYLIDTEDVTKAMKATIDEHGIEDYDCLSGIVSNHSINPGTWILYINLNDCTMGVLAHELFHATHRILEYFGVEFTSTNHEPFAYLIEYLFNECYKLKINESKTN